MNIFHSTTADGNMDMRFGERSEVEQHRKIFFERCGFPQGLFVAVMQVTHGERIVDICLEQDVYASHIEPITCEALITNRPGVPLMLLTADCYPCVIHDPVRGVVALLHLGWRPTGLRLVEKVVAHMQAQYASVAHDLDVFFGPGIAKESYVAESPAQVHEAAWQPYLCDAHDGAGMHVDVLGYARAQCIAAGVLPNHIHVDGTDTYTSPDYFSHYRATRTGEHEGRFATVVVL